MTGLEIAGLVGLAASGISAGYQAYQNRKEWDYNKRMNELMMTREDTSIGRRMKDLSDSGINPLMSIHHGGAAANAGTTRTSGDKDLADDLLMGAHLLHQQHQNRLLSKQAELTDSDREVRKAELLRLKQEYNERQRNVDYYKSKGMPSDHPPGWAHQLGGLMEIMRNPVGNILQPQLEGAKSMADKGLQLLKTAVPIATNFVDTKAQKVQEAYKAAKARRHVQTREQAEKKRQQEIYSRYAK